jgi:hypothetical protein
VCVWGGGGASGVTPAPFLALDRAAVCVCVCVGGWVGGWVCLGSCYACKDIESWYLVVCVCTCRVGGEEHLSKYAHAHL